MKFYVTFYEVGTFKVDVPKEKEAIAAAVEKANKHFAKQIEENLLEPLSEEDVAAVETE